MKALSAHLPDRHLTTLRDIEHQLLTGTDAASCCMTTLELLSQDTQMIYGCVFTVPNLELQGISVRDEPGQNLAQDLAIGEMQWLAEWYSVDGLPEAEPSQGKGHPQDQNLVITALRKEISTRWHHLITPSGSQTEASILKIAQTAHRSNTSGVLLLPLWIKGQIYGIIGIMQAERESSLSPSEKALFQGTAAALSLKLESLQAQAVAEELAQQIQHLEQQIATTAQQHTLQARQALSFEALLRRITDRVRDSLDENQILQTAVQELAIVLETHSCDTGLYNLEQQTSTIVYEYICTTEITAAKGTVLQFSDYREIYSHLLSGQNVQFCWTSPPSSWDSPPETTSRDIQERVSVLCCPLIDDQGVIGDIWLYKTADIGFDEESVRLVEQVANQCAIAIRQARLYEAAQAQVRELEHLNYLKDDFLNTVSHELRSPMANIEMSIQMLQLLLFDRSTYGDRDEPRQHPFDSLPKFSSQFPNGAQPGSSCLPGTSLPELNGRYSRGESSSLLLSADTVQQVVHYFRMLKHECTKEIHLINDLLDLSRLEAGTEPLLLTTIDLHAWIPHVVEPFLERARTQAQHLNVELPPELPPFSTDLSSLERILSELLHNACKYTPPDATITVSAQYLPVTEPLLSEQSPALILQVSNSGTELLPSELLRIFDKFYRIPSHDPWKHGGTGLGLALVKRLVDHLGGSIRAESANNHVTFTIEFPL